MSSQTTHYSSWYETYIDNMKMEETIRMKSVNQENQTQTKPKTPAVESRSNTNDVDISSNKTKAKPD